MCLMVYSYTCICASLKQPATSYYYTCIFLLFRMMKLLCLVVAAAMLTLPLCTCMHGGDKKSQAKQLATDDCEGDECSAKLLPEHDELNQRVQTDSDPQHADSAKELDEPPVSKKDAASLTTPCVRASATGYSTVQPETLSTGTVKPEPRSKTPSGADQLIPANVRSLRVTSSGEGEYDSSASEEDNPNASSNKWNTPTSEQSQANSELCTGICVPIAPMVEPRANLIQSLENSCPHEPPLHPDPLQLFHSQATTPVDSLFCQRTSGDADITALGGHSGGVLHFPSLNTNMAVDPCRRSRGSLSTACRLMARNDRRNEVRGAIVARFLCSCINIIAVVRAILFLLLIWAVLGCIPF